MRLTALSICFAATCCLLANGQATTITSITLPARNCIYSGEAAGAKPYAHSRSADCFVECIRSAEFRSSGVASSWRTDCGQKLVII